MMPEEVEEEAVGNSPVVKGEGVVEHEYHCMKDRVDFDIVVNYRTCAVDVSGIGEDERVVVSEAEAGRMMRQLTRLMVKSQSVGQD